MSASKMETFSAKSITKEFSALTSFRHEPNDPRQVEEKCLKNKKNCHPLVIGVVDRIVGLVFPVALARVVPWDIEGAIHPTVRFENFFTYSFTRLKRWQKLL